MTGPSVAELTPPHDLEAEQSLLGAMFLSPDALDSAVEEVTADDFYRPAHAKTFSAVVRLHERGEPVDIISVADELGDELWAVGGKPYLFTLTTVVPTAANVLHYAQIVKRASTQRQMIQVGTRIATLGYEKDDVQAALADARELVIGINDTGKRRAVDLQTAVRERLSDYRSPARCFSLPGSGVRMHFGDLAIIGARPGVGKTALALWASMKWAESHRVGFFSYEMSKEELADRAISAKTRVSSEYAFNGLTAGEVAIYDKALQDLPRKLFVKECAGNSVAQTMTALRMFAAGGGEIAVIDYLQLAVPRGQRMGANEATALVTNQLMALAKSTGMAVVALSQLSREGAWNTNRDKLSFPQLHQLRDSGAIEQDAAFVCLLSDIPSDGEERAAGLKYREALRNWNYEVSDDDTRKLLRVDWAKVRHGKTRVEFYHFDGETMTFAPVEKVLPVIDERYCPDWDK